MIIQKTWVPYGWGNNIIIYNNLRQIARLTSQSWAAPDWAGSSILQGSPSGKMYPTSIELSSQELREIELHRLVDIAATQNIIMKEWCLGELFFKYTVHPPSDFLAVKFPESDKVQVGIHLRGTDFFQWNPNAVLDSSYYIAALDECLKDADEELEVIIFTDDPSLDSYKKLVNYINSIGVTLQRAPDFGKPTRNHADRVPSSFLNDFMLMCQCDYLISSPSTFCISAGFLGKRKKVVHSSKWINERANLDDYFWLDLHRGGNQYYSCWKTI